MEEGKLYYKKKFRVPSARLSGWDYASDGFYFVTICTKNNELQFGEIVGSETKLNRLGELVDEYWQQIPEHFASVRLDEYVVMPNHVHGIVVIDSDINTNKDVCAGGQVRRDEACLVSTNAVSRQMQKISPKPGSLPVIIGSFKSSVTRESKTINKNFAWQARFYDRVIRNNIELNKIRHYIIENPSRWELDRNNPMSKN